MRRIGIHQVNYFPWIGYFNKMAKSDQFVCLDEVQLTDRGYSQRCPLITRDGKETFLNISVMKKGHREKKFSEILLYEQTDWRKRGYDLLKGNYSSHPYYKTVMDLIEPVFDSKYARLIEVTYCSVSIIKDALGIETPVTMQSRLSYDRDAKKNDLMRSLTEACGGDIYLSGNGARTYMDPQDFETHGIHVQYLRFVPFSYPQYKQEKFMPGLSTLDLLFNVGIDKAKELFWGNIQNNEINEEGCCLAAEYAVRQHGEKK